MKKFIILLTIFSGIITTTRAQLVHNEWVDDSITYTKDNENYLVKISILQDVIVSKSTQLDKITEVHQKIVTRERMEHLPKELWKYTSLEINNAIKQDYPIGTISSPMYYNSQKKFSNWWFPTIYKTQYQYTANGFGLVSTVNSEISIVILMITFLFTFLPFQVLRFVFAYKYSLKRINLFWASLYLGMIVFIVCHFFIGDGKTNLSIWYLVTILNVFVFSLCVLWLRNKVRVIKKEYAQNKENAENLVTE